MRVEIIARALGGRKAGDGWMARCPAHDDREPSLAIRHAHDGKVLVCCHAGCEQGRVIAALRSRGLWDQNGHRQFTHPAARAAVNEGPDRDDAKRRESALAIWRAATPASGTLVQTYLVSRGLRLPPPPSLRFHTGLKHPSSVTWPALVALVTQGVDDTPIAIHRTFIARDGSSKARISPQRMLLGPCRGGAVRLGIPGDMLMVGEGIETCLAAMQATAQPAWAALSTSGLGALVLPPSVRTVIILADNDDNGAGERAARTATQRWLAEGRRVRIAMPPETGTDFADVLAGRYAQIEEARDVAA